MSTDMPTCAKDAVGRHSAPAANRSEQPKRTRATLISFIISFSSRAAAEGKAQALLPRGRCTVRLPSPASIKCNADAKPEAPRFHAERCAGDAQPAFANAKLAVFGRRPYINSTECRRRTGENPASTDPRTARHFGAGYGLPAANSPSRLVAPDTASAQPTPDPSMPCFPPPPSPAGRAFAA